MTIDVIITTRLRNFTHGSVIEIVTPAEVDAMTPEHLAITKFYCLALSPNESRNVSRAELRAHAEKGNLFVEFEA